MVSSKFLLFALAASPVLSGGTETGSLRKPGIRQERDLKSSATKVKYRAFGTLLPDLSLDESGACYSGKFYDRKGEEELGDWSDCVTGPPRFLEGGVQQFNVTSSFQPYDDSALAISTACEFTVTPTTDPKFTEKGFNAIERCKQKKTAIVSPEGYRGVVKVKGLVNNTQFPELTFDLTWTIKYKERK